MSKNNTISFIQQLREAQKIDEREREFIVEENGKEININIIPMNSIALTQYTKEIGGIDQDDREKLMNATCDLLSRYVKDFRDISRDDLESLGVADINDLINSYFNFKNQSVIMGEILSYSNESREKQVDEIFEQAEDLKN